MDVSGLSGQQIREKLVDAFANSPGTSEAVADIETQDPGNIFGWLIEMGNGGDFQLAANAFIAAEAIVDRLININVGKADA